LSGLANPVSFDPELKCGLSHVFRDPQRVHLNLFSSASSANSGGSESFFGLSSTHSPAFMAMRLQGQFLGNQIANRNRLIFGQGAASNSTRRTRKKRSGPMGNFRTAKYCPKAKKRVANLR